MHHEDFQQLEGAWRGLHYLVNNTETDETLKIKVFNISKKDLGRTLKKFSGHGLGPEPDLQADLRRGIRPVRRRAVRHAGGRLRLRPHPAGRPAAAGHGADGGRGPRAVPGRAAPTVMQMETWNELSNPRDLTKIFQTPEYAAWRSLREIGGFSATSAFACRASSRGCPMAPRPNRSRSSPSRKRPAWVKAKTTPGATRPMRWRPTSPGHSRCMAGRRASAASRAVARSRACRRTPSRMKMAAWR